MTQLDYKQSGMMCAGCKYVSVPKNKFGYCPTCWVMLPASARTVLTDSPDHENGVKDRYVIPSNSAISWRTIFVMIPLQIVITVATLYGLSLLGIRIGH